MLVTRLEVQPWSEDYVANVLPMECSAGGDACRWLWDANGQLGIVREQHPKPGKSGIYPVWLDAETGKWKKNATEIHDSYERGLDALRDNAWAAYKAEDSGRTLLNARLKWHDDGKTETRRRNAIAELFQVAYQHQSAGVPLPVEMSPTDEIVAIPETRLDQAGPYLGADNGVICLESGRLLTGKDAAVKYITQSVGYAYEPTGEHSLANELLRHPTLAPDLTQFVIDALAWALRGYPAQRFYLLFDDGPGGAGKTALLKAVIQSLGDYGAEVDMDALAGKGRNDSGRATPELAPLAMARIGMLEEVNNRRLNQERYKRVTGGSDITFRLLFGNPQTRPVTCSLFGSGNGALQVDLAEGATRRRYTPVLYPAIPEDQRNPQLIDAFTKPMDANGRRRNAILARLVNAGIGMLAAPPVPDAVKEVVEQHAANSRGEAGLWLEENLLVVNEDGVRFDDSARVSCRRLYDMYIADNPKADIKQGQMTKLVNNKMADEGLSVARLLFIDGKKARGWSRVKLAYDYESQGGL